MELHRLPAEEVAVRRFVEELWLPYNRELEAVVEGFALADDVDVVAEEVAHRLDRLGSDGVRGWVAVEEGDDAVEARDGIDLAATDRALAGFVTTEVDESPTVFDRPDRLVVCDLYVRERHRGTGLARRLVDRAAGDARAAGCSELALDVDVDNERAVAFYEKLGFETRRWRMVADVTAV